jgi:hypothetical protein
MHFDHFKTDKDYRNSDGVRRKKRRWGGSDPHSVRLSGRPNPSRLGGATARAFRDFAAPSPAFPESGSESDLNWTMKKENHSCHSSQK